jgi:hypothetical protein
MGTAADPVWYQRVFNRRGRQRSSGFDRSGGGWCGLPWKIVLFLKFLPDFPNGPGIRHGGKGPTKRRTARRGCAGDPSAENQEATNFLR